VSVPKDYTVTYDQEKLTITNCHEIYTKNINVSKVWNDSDNNDDKRPESVTVYLYDDEGQVDSAVLNAQNDWRATFENLPVNKDGKQITYTVSEANVEGYNSTVVDCCGNFKLINTYIPVNTTVTVTKVWNDKDNQDGVRPDSVTVKVLADGDVVRTATISEAD
ncbi:MAG TPA: Cna B-type domain-containing protein, partial [Methanosphaera sp.]|nr:Cna B-type domain-containing protein [Methanosphaera sp.]